MMRHLSAMSVATLVLLVSVRAGIAQDLASDVPDVVTSGRIQAQAAALGNDPVRIFEFVRNDFEFQGYYGLMKGPEATLRSRGGNDYDLAALLVSLLRAANVPARFARGRIEISHQQARDWIGATANAGVIGFFAGLEPRAWCQDIYCGSSGTNNLAGVRIENGTVRLLHVWVEAKVRLSSYRGTGAASADAWVPLDPSFKASDWNPYFAELGDTLAGAGVHTPGDDPDLLFDYASYYGAADARLPIEIFADQVRDHLADKHPGVSLEDVTFQGRIRRQEAGVLPTALPYTVLPSPAPQRDARLENLHKLPLWTLALAGAAGTADYRYRYELRLCQESAPIPCSKTAPTTLVYEPFTAAVSGKRVTLTFPPVTPSQVPNGGYDCSPINPTTSIQAIPTISEDGVSVKTSTAVSVCFNMRSEMTVRIPFDTGGTERTKTYPATDAGGTYALALDAHATTADLVTDAAGALSDAFASYPALANDGALPFFDTDSDGLCDGCASGAGPDRYLRKDFAAQERLVGGLLHLAATRFYNLATGGIEVAERIHQRIPIRSPAMGLMVGGFQPVYVLGVPVAVIPNQLVVDSQNNEAGGVHRASGGATLPPDGVERWFDLAGHTVSAAEHTTWEEIASIEAISTMKGFQVAAEQGRTLLTINNTQQANAATAARCNGSTCTTLDQDAYCALHTAFAGVTGASQWNASCPYTSSTTTQIRVHACARLNYLDNWLGTVIYERSQPAPGFVALSFKISSKRGMAGFTCGGTVADNSIAGSGGTYGGGYAASFKPWDISLSAPPQLFSSQFLDFLEIKNFSTPSAVSALVLGGDPVSMINGNNQHVEQDLEIPGRAGLNLRVVRAYNSRLDYDGPLGAGWIHSYDQHLFRQVETGNDFLVWRNETGAEIRFEETAAGFDPEPGIFDSLVRLGDGSFDLTLRSGMRFHFLAEAQGRAKLSTIRDRNGNQITCVYNGAGRLSTVTDTASRPLQFFYDAAGKLDRIQDWTGRVWDYTVDANHDLITYTDPAASGLPTRYTYYTGSAAPNLNHNLRCWIQAAPRPVAPGVANLCGSSAIGRAWIHFSYAPTDAVANHTDSLGRTTYFGFNYFRHRSSITHPDGSSESYLFDGSGNVTRHETARGVVRRYEFEPGTRNKILERDGLGEITTATYFPTGDLQSRTDRRGFTESFTYDAYGQPLTHTDRRGAQFSWVYYPNQGSNLHYQRVRMGTTTVTLRELIYDLYGNPTTDKRLTQTTAGGTEVTVYAYVANGIGVDRITDPLGHVADQTLDALDRPTRIERTRTRSDAQIETVAVQHCYDARSRAVRTVDAGGAMRSTRFDADGLVVDQQTLEPDDVPTSPCGAAPTGRLDEQRSYDAYGRLVSIVDALGSSQTLEYDERDRAIARTTALGNREERSYDLDGNVVEVEDASGRALRFEYDAENRRVRTIDPIGRAMRVEYDEEGNLLKRFVPSSYGSGGERLAYEALTIDGEGGVVVFKTPYRNTSGAANENYFFRSYDELGRTTGSAGPLGPAPAYTPKAENTSLLFSYDLTGRLRTKSNPVTNRGTTITYDLRGQTKTVTDSLGRTSNFDYDEVGNLVRSVDGDAMQMDFEYDARGLVTRRHGFAVDDRYSYDGRGRRETATNAVSSHRFRYDDRDRIIEHYGSLMGTARFAYDLDGRLQHVVYPQPPSSAFTQWAQATYQYDPAGRVISIQDNRLAAGANSQTGSWGFSWDAVGRLATRTDPNGIRRTATFVTEGFVDTLRFAYPDGTNQLIDYGAYDDFGSPGSIDYGGGEITNPVYDAVGRLTSASIPPFAGSEQFDIDSDGNRTRYWQGGDNRRLLVDAAHQAYRVERVSNSVRLENFGYDGAGRRELYNEWDEASGAVPASQLLTRSTAYGYDGLGRLAYVTRTGGYAMTLDYGPLGERIRRTEVSSTGAQPVVSLYLGGLVELRDIGASGVAQTAVRLVAGPGPAGFVGEVTAAGELRSLLGDAGHNVIRAAVIAGAGPYTSSVYSRRYRAFGQAGFASGTVLVERGFAGQVPEGQSGVVYMNARHYDPVHGRFLQPDPLGVQSDQPYAYAANNPFLFADPLGLNPVSLNFSSFDFGFLPFGTGSSQLDAPARRGSSYDSPIVPDSYRVSVGGGLGVVGNADLSFAPDRSFQGGSVSVGFGLGGRVGVAALAQENLEGLPTGAAPRVTFGTSVSYSPLAVGPLVGFDTRVGSGGFTDASFSGGVSVGAPIFACAPCISFNFSAAEIIRLPQLFVGSGTPGNPGPPPITAIPPF